MERRLPIFLIVDVSESMAGEESRQLAQALGEVLTGLRKDPAALETAFISVIAFAGRCRTLLPLTELVAVQQPDLPIGGGTALGAALDHVMNEIDGTVVQGRGDRRGDWRPIVFLFTDGRPTDSPDAAVSRWHRGFANRASIVAVSFGGQADHAVLRRLTETVLVFDDTAPDAYAGFARWLTQSIQAQSRSVITGGEDMCVAAADSGVIGVAGDDVAAAAAGAIDHRVVCLVGRCRVGDRPYLMKFVAGRDPVGRGSGVLRRRREPEFTLRDVVPLTQDYFDMSDSAAPPAAVDLQRLSWTEQVPCPHCRAEFGISRCTCGNITCIPESSGTYTCPWCRVEMLWKVQRLTGSVNRGRG